MLVLLVRAVLVYLLVIAGMRLMGKRQIGELQPAELVITLLISDIATEPLQSVHAPLLQSILVITVLIALEMLFSVLSLKFNGFRTLTQGNSVLLIENGRIRQKELRALRYTVDDLLEALRLKDVFRVSDVAFAYAETNGELSVLKRQPGEQAVLPCLVVCDGAIIEKEFSVCGLTRERLLAILKEKMLSPEQVFLMTYTRSGDTHIVVKEG